ncbi:DUF5665 domain-containing protein [Salsuginibacillus kocurii]|uniref:DUF5665 domain-containing protein n=1 Tax=Salsuginibacillus kocurii TaxID=427078 RepID=UPI0003815F2E|nr:DUF5665 domain-containing protein [Salsuginibacillus kocurii]
MEIPAENRTRRLPEIKRNESEEERLAALIDKLEDATTRARLKDLAYHFTNKREVIKVNIIAGAARGVGLTLGTAIFLALFFFIVAQLVDMPLVGDFNANILDEVDQHRETAATHDTIHGKS